MGNINTHQVTVSVCPDVHTDLAVGLVIGGATASRWMIPTGLATTVAAKARRSEATYMMVGSMMVIVVCRRLAG